MDNQWVRTESVESLYPRDDETICTRRDHPDVGVGSARFVPAADPGDPAFGVRLSPSRPSIRSIIPIHLSATVLLFLTMTFEAILRERARQ